MTAALELDDVTRTYGTGRTEVTALRGVSLRVAAGEVVAVMGPSGSGKTTLLSLAGGLDRPTHGTVSVAGVPLHEQDRAGLAAVRRRTIGYVFQELNLLATLTAAENVSLPLELDGVRERRARARAHELLEQVGLGALVDRFPDDLSGGEQQRVAIARACVGQRRLLLADEPTGALDSVTGDEVLALLRARAEQEDVAVVLVTHEARHAAWADRVLFLRDGRAIDTAGPPAGPETLLSRDGGEA